MNFFGNTIICACAIAAPSMIGTEIEKVKEILSILDARTDTGRFKPFSAFEKQKISHFLETDLPKIAEMCALDQVFLEANGAPGTYQDRLASFYRSIAKHFVNANNEGRDFYMHTVEVDGIIESRIPLSNFLKECAIFLSDSRIPLLVRQIKEIKEKMKPLAEECSKLERQLFEVRRKAEEKLRND